MKILKYISLALIVISVGACQENETMLYDTDYNALNFKLKNDRGYGPDSLYVNFMFGEDESLSETTKVRLKLMGVPEEVDRHYKVNAVIEESTAEAGVHYEAFENEYVFPAGETETYFELVALRDESLGTATVRLMVELVPSDNFEAGIENEQRFIINITDNLITPPPFWEGNYLHYYAGPYHWKKCKKYIEIAGVDAPDWHPEPYAAGDVYIKETRKWFEENPTFDEDGNRLYFENR